MTMYKTSEKEKFDTKVRDRYGNKTCILFKQDSNYELRNLETNITKTIDNNEIYIEIPEMLKKDYIVVIIEEFTNKKMQVERDITTVHMPRNTLLAMPPIIE